MNKIIKRMISFLLAAALICSGAVGLSFDGLAAASAASDGPVACNVKFSKPAICCDVGALVDLAGCAVQFSPEEGMTVSGITWSYQGAVVTSFTPTGRGVHTLTATANGKTKNIYVVAKAPEETEYVLYRNDFNTAPTDFRVIEKSNGGSVSVSDGAYILDGSSAASSYVRVLLPSFLDDFGDVKMEAAVKITNAVDEKKWGSLMFRVQEQNKPYYQACLRSGITAENGVEISQRNSANDWEVYKNTSFAKWYADQYNVCTVTLKGVSAILNINSYDVLQYGNMSFANGAFGFQTRAAKTAVDYVKITLDGNEPLMTSAAVSFSKPAIRADIGDTIDLTRCSVQFFANSLYTNGSNITWEQDGVTITSFTPSQTGVTKLTAISGSTRKNVYVVTRTLNDGEYVLYYNDFTTAPTDFRVVQTTKSTVYHDGDGHYVIDASSANTAYGRVLLPSFLDDFGDMKLEARYMDSDPNTDRNWSSLMFRVQNGDYPYMQMCIRSDATVSDGVEISQRNDQNQWNVMTTAATEEKIADAYNTYHVMVQNNNVRGFINGTSVIVNRHNMYTNGAMGLQAKGLKITVDYVRVSLGENTNEQDTAMKCTVSKLRPAIGCYAGQKVLLSQCDVQFVYGASAVDGSQITWKKDGVEITEYAATSEGLHTLTATFGSETMTVYIVAKKSTDYEYELYYNDFTAASHDLTVAEASNGGTCTVKNGALVLNGSSNKNAFVRAFLPSYMDQFSDVKMEASIKLTAPVDSTKWGALIFAAQNKTNQYYQGCIRYDTTAEDGVEISHRNTDNTWTVQSKAAYSGWKQDAYNTVILEHKDTSAKMTINGTKAVSYSKVPYQTGGWGLQVRASTMTVDYLRVMFVENHTNLTIYSVPGHYAQVRDPETKIQIAPSMITEVKTRADFDALLDNSPAVAIMNYEVVNGEGRVVFADGVISPEAAFHRLGTMVIPAFRISSNEAADSLASFLIGQDCQDAYAVSSTPSVLKRAYQKWKYIRGVVDYSNLTSYDAEEIRSTALSNYARVLIMPESTSKDTITQLQDSYSCVWLTVSQGTVATVTAVNKGPYGLITPDRALTQQCFRDYYGENTMIRSPVLIGHRGNPSTNLENTISAANAAYSYGANAVENDIYLLTDGVLMVMHDGTIDRTTNGTGNTNSFSSSQLKQYVVDYPANMGTETIPTLEDYLKLVQGNKNRRLVIELKENNSKQAKPLADLLKKYDLLDQVVIITFYYNGTAIQALRSQVPGIPVGTLGGITFDNSKPVFLAQEAIELITDNFTVCNPSYKGLGSENVRALAHRGVTIWPWTLRNQTDFDNMMIVGVGGITTDYCQWGTNYVEELTFSNTGRVIATTYGGTKQDVSQSAELVVLEDTLGISFTNGVLNVPQNHGDGYAKFFFRYKTTNPSGTTYYTVTEVQTAYAGEHRYTAQVTAATCTKAGYTTYTCSCGDSYIDHQVPATGHSNKTTFVPSTCTAEGKKVVVCTVCGETNVEFIPAAGHSYVWDTCSVCGYVDENYSAPSYYLFGYINGANYACEEDYENMGIYRFINGQVTASFEQDSYVAVKTEGNGIWFMTDGWQGTDVTSVTMYDTRTFDTTNANKLYVPANTYVAFTIEENEDGSLTLSYAPAVCNHRYTCIYKTQPTCTTPGEAVYRCDFCNREETEILPVIGHSWIWDTCSECGYVNENYKPAEYYLFGYINGEDYACEGDQANMGQYRFVDGQLSVTFSQLSYVAVKTAGNAAWYMTDGWRGAEATEAVLYNTTTLSKPDKLCVPAKLHLLFTLTENPDGSVSLSYEIEENHSYEKTVYDPTCTRIGYTLSQCACGKSVIENRLPAKGHSCSIQVIQPTCTTGGYTVYTCDCGYSYQDDITAATDHSYQTTVLAATCTTDGRKTYTCTGCGDQYAQTLPAAGHSYKKIVTKPTCKEGGYSTYICVCGDAYTANAVPATGHRYKVAVQPATCAKDGSRTTTCLNCGETVVKIISATPHRYIWGVCSICGHQDSEYAKPTYYLCGYINGMNYGVEEDFENMGSYQFADGKLTAIFSADSYVMVKTAGNGAWYMTNGWQGEGATSAVLYDTTTISGASADKLFVPANTYVTFTLQENPDGTLKLSYAPEICKHSYQCVSTIQATCTADGESVYRCENCWDSYSVKTSAFGHSYHEGICGRCGEKDPNHVFVTQPTIKLKYPTLIFEDEILMNVYYSIENTEDVLSMGMITYDSKVSQWSVEDAQNVLPGYTWSDTDGLYYVTTNGIPAKKLGDTIYFAIYAMLSDGSYSYSNLVSYSPKTYLYNRLKSGEPAVQSLMAAALNYGAAAQIYFDYKTESLVNEDMTQEQQAMVQDYSDTMVDAVRLPDAAKLGEMKSNGGYIKRYPTISFEGAFGINYYFQPSSQPVGQVTMYVWNQEDYDAVDALRRDNATQAISMTLTDSGEYLAVVDGISAKDLDKGIYVSFCYSDGTTDYCSGVVGYSIGLYCKSQAAKTGLLSRLAAATAVYGYYAKQLFG